MFIAELNLWLCIFCFIFLCFYWILVVVGFDFTALLISLFISCILFLYGFNFLYYVLHLRSHTLDKRTELISTNANGLMFSETIQILFWRITIFYNGVLVLWVITEFTFLWWSSLHLEAKSLFFNVIPLVSKTSYCKFRSSNSNFRCSRGSQKMSLIRFIPNFLLAIALSF